MCLNLNNIEVLFSFVELTPLFWNTDDKIVEMIEINEMNDRKSCLGLLAFRRTIQTTENH